LATVLDSGISSISPSEYSIFRARVFAASEWQGEKPGLAGQKTSDNGKPTAPAMGPSWLRSHSKTSSIRTIRHRLRLADRSGSRKYKRCYKSESLAGKFVRFIKAEALLRRFFTQLYH
jgi:hypothetical protein